MKQLKIDKHYISLLIVIIIFVSIWAYAKYSQIEFKQQSTAINSNVAYQEAAYPKQDKINFDDLKIGTSNLNSSSKEMILFSKYYTQNIKNKYKYVFIHFWATWCPSCINEIPKIVDFQRKNILNATSGQNFSDYFIITVASQDSIVHVKKFLKKLNINEKDTKKLNIEWLIEESGQLANTLGTHKLPETFLIKEDGEVIDYIQGPTDWMPNTFHL